MDGHDYQTSGGRTLHLQQTAPSCLCPSCNAQACVSKLPGHRHAMDMHACMGNHGEPKATHKQKDCQPALILKTSAHA
jgi:hypothetical protein